MRSPLFDAHTAEIAHIVSGFGPPPRLGGVCQMIRASPGFGRLAGDTDRGRRLRVYSTILLDQNAACSGPANSARRWSAGEVGQRPVAMVKCNFKG